MVPQAFLGVRYSRCCPHLDRTAPDRPCSAVRRWRYHPHLRAERRSRANAPRTTSERKAQRESIEGRRQGVDPSATSRQRGNAAPHRLLSRHDAGAIGTSHEKVGTDPSRSPARRHPTRRTQWKPHSSRFCIVRTADSARRSSSNATPSSRSNAMDAMCSLSRRLTTASYARSEIRPAIPTKLISTDMRGARTGYL